MTCIVGIESKGKVYVGGDSAGTRADGSQRSLADKKVFINDGILFGVCGLPKVMDALEHGLDVPKRSRKDNVRKYINRQLMPAIIETLDDAQCTEKHHGSSSFEGAFLMAFAGKLYTVETNFQVITTARGFNSVGSGSDIAMGSLHASRNVRNARARILTALEASAINNAAVRPPFTVLSV